MTQRRQRCDERSIVRGGKGAGQVELRQGRGEDGAKITAFGQEEIPFDEPAEETFGGSGATWSTPQGGCYIWLSMPESVNMTELQPKCFEAGVGYLPGSTFSPNGNGDHCARLCYAYESPEKNRAGIELLASLLDREGAFRGAPGP